MLVDITKDVTANVCEFETKAVEYPEKPARYTEDDIEQAISLINQAKKPYIYLGGGVIASDASAEVKELAEKIGDVVGQRGKTINEIIARTGVKIDITDDGAVSVCGTDAEKMEEAMKMIATIVTEFEAGMVFEGKVISIKEFGAFVEFAPGKEGMVHISKISKERIKQVEDVLTLGDKVKVVCLGKDKMGRISFSMRDVVEE